MTFLKLIFVLFNVCDINCYKFLDGYLVDLVRKIGKECGEKDKKFRCTFKQFVPGLSSLCWEGGEEGGRDGGREGGEEDLYCVCVQTDRWCTVCTLIVKQHMSLCTCMHDEN